MEDDDDEGFGDFTFAAPVSMPSTNLKINGGSDPDLSFNNNLKINGGDHANNDDDNDDWGDFVSSPTVSSTQSMKTKPFEDPFNFVSGTKPNRPDPVGSKWVRPSGALPLSLFGEVEEEEEDKSGGAGPVGYSGPSSTELKKTNNKDANGGDSVSDLLKQNQQRENSNGSKVDLNGSVLDSKNSSSSGLKLVSNQLKSSVSNGDFDWGFISKTDHKVEAGNGAVSDFGVFGLSWNVGGSGLNGLSLKGAEVKSDGNGMALDFSGVISEGNGLSLNSKGVNVDVNGLSNEVNADVKGSSLVGDDEDFGDDDEWEFQDAKSEALSGDDNAKVDRKDPENFVGDGVHNSTNLFVASNGIPQKSGDWDIGFDFSKSSVTQDVSNCNSYSITKHKNDNENGFSSTMINGHVDNGANFWEFKDAFSETGSKDNEFIVNENGLKSTPVDGHADNVENNWSAFSDTGSKDKGNEVKFENQKGALPLSLFGDEEPQTETGDHLNPQDVPAHSTTRSTIKDVKKSLDSTVPLNDLIASLYSQAEQNTSVNHTCSKSENAIDSVPEVLDSNLEIGNGDFDDDSWEFKDAFSGSIAVNHTSVANHGDLLGTNSNKVEPKDYVDFYSKLKHELYFVSQCHFDNLKKARDTAAVCGNDAEVKALDGEIQDLYNELHQENITSKEAHLENHTPNNICLKEFVEVLQEPKFHVLESEYHLSKKLLSVEKEWTSAVELLKHAASMSKILKLGSSEDRSNYVLTWFKMVSVCAQELRLGALIWKQALDQNVQSQILPHPRGKQYILALGEIYRLVEVLGCSVKLYKPWVLLSSADPSPSAMFTLLSECFTLWKSSGLEEAFQNICDAASSEYDRTPKDLIESVNYIHDLDVLALDNRAFSGEEPTCRLSALAAGTIPGMKMVVWNGQHYFVTLANLWANLISSDPPNLPLIQVG